MVQVLIGADVCPIEGNRQFFVNGDAPSLFNDLLPEFQSADFSIANLECPLIEEAAPIPKTGPHFGEPAECLNGIKQAGLKCLSLANNHILDHGPAGLLNTLRACKKAGIETVGAGADIHEASRMLVKTINGLRLGVISMAEHEFSIAGKTRAGANPLDLIEFVRTVKSEWENFDFLIVLYHGAHEFQAVTPRVQKTCRFFVEMGADVVVVQHPHDLGGFEAYQGGHIIYGQGALLMDEALYRDLESFHRGVLVKLALAAEAPVKMELIPFAQSAPLPGARKLSAADGSSLLAELERKSRILRDPDALAAQWREFCRERRHGYVSSLLGHNRVLRKLNSAGLLEKRAYGPKRLLGTRNIVSCETHQEAILTIWDELGW
jgi:poly-gamma-glutamate synthesis protein (capsule biosynthesis protein)